MVEANKSKSEGVCFMVNTKWCKAKTLLFSHYCSPDLEYLTIKCHLFYLSCECKSVVTNHLMLQKAIYFSAYYLELIFSL